MKKYIYSFLIMLGIAMIITAMPARGISEEPQTPFCGNNTTEAGETCDDGNIMPEDGCSATCQIEIQTETQCSDAIDNDGDGYIDCDDSDCLIDASCQAPPTLPDTDADTIPDSNDNCVYVSNTDQADADGDGIGSVCDNCPNLSNVDQLDADGDKIGNTCDNCAQVANSGQQDDDHDGIGNACDPYNCTATGAEICGDGIDNDCDDYSDNGKIDNSGTDEYCTDTTAPTIRVDSPDDNSEVSGNISISTYGEDNDSLIKNVCVFYGSENPDNPISENNCKDNSQREWHSHDYAPNHTFSWNTASTTDGTYKVYAIATDNAGNTATSSPKTITINNYSLGTPENPAKITTCQEFQDVRNHLRWYYTIENDIDCSETKNWNYGQGFQEIGHNNGFSGRIDGKNHIISGIYINSSENRGIFGYIQGGKVENVVFKDVDVICNSTYCAVLTNVNWGTIEKVGITGKFACSGNCGGFASQNSGTIFQCWADLKITSSNQYGGPGQTGIIAGQGYSGNIRNCYAKGSLVATQGGGIVGINQSSNISTSYSVANINNANDWSGSAGLIGWQYSGGSQTNSYWDKETSGKNIMCGSTSWNSPESCNDENGLTDAQAKKWASYQGFDFETIWRIDENKNDGYPYLAWQTFFTQKDITNPVITLKGDNPATVYVGDVYTDAGATATDNVDGDITSKIEIKNKVDISKVGEYLVTYDVMDNAGNEANQQARTVNVIARPVSGGGGTGGQVIIKPVSKITPKVAGASFYRYKRVLKYGMQGEDVKVLQQFLTDKGFYKGAVSGKFGRVTEKALKAYQLANNIPQTGILDAQTLSKMLGMKVTLRKK